MGTLTVMKLHRRTALKYNDKVGSKQKVLKKRNEIENQGLTIYTRLGVFHSQLNVSKLMDTDVGTKKFEGAVLQYFATP